MRADSTPHEGLRREHGAGAGVSVWRRLQQLTWAAWGREKSSGGECCGGEWRGGDARGAEERGGDERGGDDPS